jgi:transposase InsO family protein
MYVTRMPELKYQAAVLAEAIPFIDNLKCRTIKDLARSLCVSEKQLHRWKSLLREEGLRLFSTLRPGRRKKEVWKSYPESEHLLIYETINRLLIKTQKDGETNQKFSPAEKQTLLFQRTRLKSEHGLTYEQFSQLIGIDSGSLRLWARRVKTDGLQEKSRAPKRCANKLPAQVIRAIEQYGRRWQRLHRTIRITEFSVHFRFKHRRLLRRFGKSTLSDKVIARYLKQAGLYKQREETLKGQRGRFRYYFPGAQSIIDTTAVVFLGVRLKLIAVLDAFSRNILHQEGFPGENAEAVIRVLKSGLKVAGRNGLKVLSVLSDHGRPYKSGRVRRYLKENGICRNLAAPYRPQGKAALERYFRTAKETLSSKGGLIQLFFRGLWQWLKVRLVKAVFNLILLGYTGLYNRTRVTSPGASSTGMVRPQFQESVRRVLQAEEQNSELKSELIDRVYSEFFPSGAVRKSKVKEYLSGYRKQDITEAAVALRRKLVVENLPATNRWWYLSKVADNIEKKRKEEELRKARQTIRFQQQRIKDEQETAKTEEDIRWYERHPEEALEKTVGWYLLLCNFPVARGHYRREIIRLTETIMASHSVLTAGRKLEKLCERIKEAAPLTGALRDNTEPQPTVFEIERAREEIISVLKRHNFRGKQDIPTAQNLRRLWIK